MREVTPVIVGQSEYCEKALKALEKLPPFSPVLTRLLATLGEEDVPYSRIAEIIEKDTVIAGNVLKVVNSALYGRRDPITSVPRAISILGVAKLRNTVFSMSISRLWNSVRTPASWSMARFNIHSVATAILADLLAQHTPVFYGEGAFIAGLFHDIGKLLIAVGLPDQFEMIRARQNDGPRIEMEREVLGFTHAELSAEAVARWKAPEPVHTAVLYHHSPALDPTEAPNGTGLLSGTLAAADMWLNASGVSSGDASNDDPEAAAQLPPEVTDSVQVVFDEFRTEFEAMSAFFQ